MSERLLSVFKKTVPVRYFVAIAVEFLSTSSLHKDQHYYPYKQMALNAK